MFTPRKILVPTDFSEFSDNALRTAIDVAKQHDSRVYLLHVVGLVRQCTVDYCLDSAVVEEVEKKSVESARDLMEQQIRRVAKPGEAEIVSDVKQGIAYQEVLREQEEQGIDLVVIGSRGKTGLLGHLGSVTDRVARAAKCPVLVVKEE